MNAQERFDALPDHYVQVNVEAIVKNWLIGQWAVANHPESVLNSNIDGFKIIDVEIKHRDDHPHGSIYVRGENTCWFAQGLYKINICPF